MKYLLVLFFLFSCTKGPSTPEGLLEMYIKDITTAKQDKDYYEKYTSGVLWESIVDLSEEDFDKFRTLKKVKEPRLEVLSKDCPVKSECNLTYILKYKSTGEENAEYKSEVKKIASIKKVEGDWRIFEVKNIKTYLDSGTPIEVPQESK